LLLADVMAGGEVLWTSLIMMEMCCYGSHKHEGEEKSWVE
jgi:hypothetical protein